MFANIFFILGTISTLHFDCLNFKFIFFGSMNNMMCAMFRESEGVSVRTRQGLGLQEVYTSGLSDGWIQRSAAWRPTYHILRGAWPLYDLLTLSDRVVLPAIAQLSCCYLLLSKLLQRPMSVDGSSERWNVSAMVSSCCCNCCWRVADSCSDYRLLPSSVVSCNASVRRPGDALNSDRAECRTDWMPNIL